MAGLLCARVAGVVLLVAPCLVPPSAAQPPPSVPAVVSPGAQGPIEGLWAQGERAYRAGDLDAALRFFEEAIARDDRRGRSWNYAGGVHFARGDFNRALEHFRRAHELDPLDVRVCNNLGTAHERLGDFALAEKMYLEAARLDPLYPETHRNLGVLYARRLGRPEDARHSWQRYLDLVPAGSAAAAVRRELEFLPLEQAPAPAP